MKNSKLMLIFMIFITVFCVTGCGEKKESNEVSNDATSKKSEILENSTNSTTTSSSTTTTTSTTSTSTTTKKTTTKKTTTTSKKTNVKLGKNEYITLKDNKVRKYTFTYPDEATCVKLGDNEPYEVVYPKRPYMVFGCEKIKDAKGNILWGEYFMESTDASSKFYY